MDPRAFLSLYFLLIVLLGCHQQVEKGPSVLLIAVEGLSGTNFSCNSFDESERSGFQTLCNEAVRFTHAFTTSPLTQAALGSILTAELPIENGLRDNGHSFLTARKVTLTEKLSEKKTRTLFIASAPTVKRYSRLHQGFERFHDDYEFTATRIYRPFSESLQIFQSWLKQDVDRSAFFAIIHVADLLFPEVITQTELLEPRARGIEGQFEEIDENLYLLIKQLKQLNLWNKTYVIVTGLNGVTESSRFNEIPGSNLFTENVSVPLFIKPLKGREEIPHQWKVDVHVTLQDVGVTLEDIFDVNPERSRPNHFRSASLLQLIGGRSDSRFANRPIMIESAWAEWAINSPPRYSVRDNQWLVIFDRKPLLYNTLTDRAEMNRVSLKDNSYQEAVDQLANLFINPIPQAYEKPDPLLNDEFQFARLLVENDGRSIDHLIGQIRSLIKNNIGSETIRWLLVDQLVKRKKWDLIQEFNILWQDLLLQQILELREGKEPTIKENFCLDLLPFKDKQAHAEKDSCTNKDFHLMVDWLAAQSERKEVLLDKFSLIYKYQALQLKLIFFDLSRGGVVLGANTRKLKELVLFRLALSFPHFQKDLSTLERRVGL